MGENKSKNLIPKKIHYCWFGGKELTRSAKKCISSWEKFCPDYEIIRWSEANFNINENKYAAQAYHCKKWAFVSDYARLKVIFTYGGIYLDTDVELINPLDKFLCYKAFMGFEDENNVATCIIGAVPNHEFSQKALDTYENRPFLLENGECDTTTNVRILTDLLLQSGLAKGGKRQKVMETEIFSADYFSPKSLATGKTTLTENTCAIHHFKGSWQTKTQRLHTKAAQILGEKNTEFLKKKLRKE